ncbi:MAG: peptidylprolyl isomerase [Rhodospirillaceae bacterium]|nr:peptidylprolyl isomerase [Rhodospirillaceae bacterium]
MAIQVNDCEIPDAAVAAEVQHHPSATLEAAHHAAAEALVIREILIQEARRQGIASAPRALGAGRAETEEEALIRALLDREIAVPQPDEPSLRRYYDNNRRRFCSPAVYEAAHIFFPAAADDTAARARAHRQAADTLADLTDDPAAFPRLARERSACSSAEEGGSLGQVSRGQVLPEFETFLATLEPGQICPVPVPTRYGYHVVRLDRREGGRQIPFELVAGRIAAYLTEQTWNRGVAHYIRILAGRARIEGFAFTGAAPLQVG